MPFLRRAAGALLLAAAYLPLHRLLDPARAGPAGAATRAAADAAWTLGVSGSLIVLAFAWLCARMVPVAADGPGRLARIIEVVETPRAVVFSLGVGAAATVVAALVALLALGAAPTSVDEMTQLLHARALTAGRLTLPLEGEAASWIVQNGVVTERGWASIYPPLHTVLLALGAAVGLAWLVGPVATGVATFAATWSAERLLGPRTGRSAGLLLLVSPYWIVLGATHLSHSTAAAGLALLLAASLRARDGGARWALAVGAAAGVAVSARPWVGLAAGAAIVLATWLPFVARLTPASIASRVGAVLLGGLPFALLLFGWNAALFDGPLRLGYSVAFGPAHGLGWHADPWGNAYGALEALAYSGADLVQLGAGLFASPLPALAVIALALLAWREAEGTGPFWAWATSAVGANALYWHHGLHFGPRMLFESTPAWVVLFALVVSRTLLGDRGVGPEGPSMHAEGSGARFARWTLGIAIVGGLALAPLAVGEAAARKRSLTPPSLGHLLGRASTSGNAPARVDGSGVRDDSGVEEAPILVFVHGSWSSRVAARLAATGMRRDSIETALRRNGICAVDRHARARGRGDPQLPPLDFEALPGSPPHLQARLVSPGYAVRVDPAVEPDAGCLREARSDRLGVLELEPLAWRFPPLEGAALIVARDLGPAGNAETLERHAGRTALVFVDRAAPEEDLVLAYADGMELLWGGAAAESAGYK